MMKLTAFSTDTGEWDVIQTRDGEWRVVTPEGQEFPITSHTMRDFAEVLLHAQVEAERTE